VTTILQVASKQAQRMEAKRLNPFAILNNLMSFRRCCVQSDILSKPKRLRISFKEGNPAPMRLVV